MRKCRDNFMKRQKELLNKMKVKQAMKGATGLLQEHQKQLKEDQQRQQALKAQQQQRERDEKFERDKKEADKLRQKQEEEALNKEVEQAVAEAVAGIPLFPDVESGYNSGIE